jgi:isocitrate lyase
MRTNRHARRLIAAVLLGGWMTTVSASELEADRRTQAALGLDAHPQSGARLYEANCQACHGPDARGGRTATHRCSPRKDFPISCGSWPILPRKSVIPLQCIQ